MSKALDEALAAVARLRGDPALDAAAWRLLLDAIKPPPDFPREEPGEEDTEH